MIRYNLIQIAPYRYRLHTRMPCKLDKYSAHLADFHQLREHSVNRFNQLNVVSSIFLCGALLMGCGGSDHKKISHSSSSTSNSSSLSSIQQSSSSTSSVLPYNATLQQSLNILGVAAATADVSEFAGSPKCGVDIYHYTYNTKGGKGEATKASAALFVPTGAAPTCSGARPLLIDLHGTDTRKKLNLANLSEDEAQLSVAYFAAQGYITIMPNYAGYDTSDLAYHPYLNADQQSQDVIDAMTAGKKVLAAVSTSTKENGKLFLTGYSQGGHVSMATHRAMQARGMTVTASVGGAGPYALSFLVDKAFKGEPSDGAFGYIMMIIDSYQNSYADIYKTPSDIYTTKFASVIEKPVSGKFSFENLLSKDTPALFGTDAPNYVTVAPKYQSFYGAPEESLIKSSYLTEYLNDVGANPCSINLAQPLACSPKDTLRAALLKNDLRNWVPTSPMLLCGGHDDTQVYFISSQDTKAYFDANGAKTVSLLDVDSPINPNDPYATAKNTFLTQKNQVINAANAAGVNPDELLREYSHYLPFAACNIAARNFFDSF